MSTKRGRIKVTVYEKATYRFANDRVRCPAHGQALCISCARTNGDECQCTFYDETGMHWDTCPGRVR